MGNYYAKRKLERRLINCNNIPEFHRIIRDVSDINIQLSYGYTILHMICSKDSRLSNQDIITAVNLLIQSRININLKDNIGFNVLHQICSKNTYLTSSEIVSIIRILIPAGINVNEKINTGWNVMHIICSNNTYLYGNDILMAMQLLIDAGIDVNAKQSGFTALHHLCKHTSLFDYERIQAIKILINAGAFPVTYTYDDKSPEDFLRDNNISENTKNEIYRLLRSKK